MTSFINTLVAVGPALCLTLYAALIGYGLQAALASQARFAIGFGVVCGVGLGVSAVAMCLSHVLLGNVTLPLVPLAILAILALIVRFVRNARNEPRSLRQVLTDVIRQVTVLDLIAAVAAALVMLPLLRFGLSYWTTGTHDYPNYVASAQIWTTSVAEFAARHPDSFGELQVARASYEKPMVTALLVAMSAVSGTPTSLLLAPAMLVFLYVTFASLLVLCARVFRLGAFAAGVAVLPASLALVPMSRVYDAQPGQVAAVALLACLFAVLAATPTGKTLRSTLALAAVAGVVWAAAIGSNFTLVVGSGVTLSGLLLWSVCHDRNLFPVRLRAIGISAAVAIVLSIPMLRMYLKSFSSQTGGEPGFDIPLVSPLAALGQQLSLFRTVSTEQALLSWGVVLVALLAIVWVRSRIDRRSALFDLVLVGAVIANVMVIGLRLGWVNYAVHKWVALAVVLVTPLVLSYCVSGLTQRARMAAVAALAVLTLSSAQISLGRALSMDFIASKDLMALHASAQLASEDQLNLRLRSRLSENMLAALMVPADVIILTDRSYAQGSPPVGNRFLVKTDALERMNYTDLTRLNDTYAVASLDLTLEASSIDFTTANPPAERFLFGGWYDPESDGTWSGQYDNYLVFDVPEDLRSGGVRLSVTGQAYANAEASQTIRILVNGEKVAERTYPDAAGEPIELTVSAAAIEAADGRIAVNFRAPERLSPSAFGSSDKRSLAFMLARLDIAPL